MTAAIDRKNIQYNNEKSFYKLGKNKDERTKVVNVG